MRSVDGMKKCSHCEAVLSLDNFYNNRSTTDGKQPECKACHNAGVKRRRANDPDKRKRQDAEYRHRNPERRREIGRAYVARHAREHAERGRQFRIESPEKYRAQSLLNRAIKSGKIVRSKTCEVCGAVGRIEGHHPDYAMPYLVKWLCKPCHYKADRNRLEGPEVWNLDYKDEALEK